MLQSSSFSQPSYLLSTTSTVYSIDRVTQVNFNLHIIILLPYKLPTIQLIIFVINTIFIRSNFRMKNYKIISLGFLFLIHTNCQTISNDMIQIQSQQIEEKNNIQQRQFLKVHDNIKTPIGILSTAHTRDQIPKGWREIKEKEKQILKPHIIHIQSKQSSNKSLYKNETQGKESTKNNMLQIQNYKPFFIIKQSLEGIFTSKSSSNFMQNIKEVQSQIIEQIQQKATQLENKFNTKT